MMNNFEKNLDKYADLTVRVGINIQKGQKLVVNAPIAAADFVRKVAKKAYEAGAKDVHVEWNDEQITLIKFLNAPDESFKEFPTWRAKGFEQMASEGAAFLTVHASNPDLLKDVDPERIATATKTSATAMQEYRKYIQDSSVSWLVVSVPTREWATKVFPGLNDEESIEKLWESIFNATRVNEDNPVEAWQKHVDNLDRKLEYLNSKAFKKLYFKSSETDLKVELPENHIWVGAGQKNEKGVVFVPNMPTEEVFTMPHKEGISGVVKSTKPLNYAGNIIDNFSLTFERGRIVDFAAEKGYDTLKNLIETDEGAHFIGEVALVPHDSPVSNTNIIFYNTLFDENASSHLAIGSAYPLCIEDGTKMSKDELEKNGANISLIHVDFMIGSEDMNIDGETSDGKLEPVFRNGNWAF
jgi:aminopeptidase